MYTNVFTYLRTLMVERNRSLDHKIQLCRQLLPALVISLFESSVANSCLIHDKTHEIELIAKTHEDIFNLEVFLLDICIICTNSNKQ